MIFQVGKTYNGFFVTARTKCFVTFGGVIKKKVHLSQDGMEYTLSDPKCGAHIILAKEEITESPKPIETAPDAPIFAPIFIEPSANPINEPVAVSGANDHEPIIVIDSDNQKWLLVGADTANCLFEAVEHREIGNAPRTRTMPLKEVQALYGWGQPEEYDRRYLRPANGFEFEVYCDHESAGYAIAELIWAYRESDELIDMSFEREQTARMWARDEIKERIEYSSYSYDLMRY
jgi:hypothetical protein